MTKRSAVKKITLPEAQLGSIIERDGTPENGAQLTLDSIISPSNTATKSNNVRRLEQLSALNTPQTAPKPTHSEMHPELAHKSTTKAPDSGQRLGFRDVVKKDSFDTPSRFPTHPASSDFKFRYVADKGLSQDAEDMRAEIREKASRIKEQMRAQRNEHEGADEGLVSAVGRKIAMPRGRAGRFSDVHMAEFKKMDSIENHPSSFRAQPKFAQPTVNSLKRTSSKAGLDEPVRPRTAGKDSVMTNDTHTGSQTSPDCPSSFRFGFPSAPSSQISNRSKRARKDGNDDVSTMRPTSKDSEAEPTRCSTLPRPKSSSNLFTPTKASMGRSQSTKTLSSSPSKSSLIPRSTTIREVKSSDEQLPAVQKASCNAASKSIPKSISMKELRDATTMPTSNTPSTAQHVQLPAKLLSAAAATPLVKPQSTMKSKLPTLSSLKSILRRTTSRPISNDPVKIAAGTHIASEAGNQTVNRRLDDLSSDGVQNVPDRRATFFKPAGSSQKRVEFTPSVKDRYELAAASPSPVKGMMPKDVPDSDEVTSELFDSKAYIINDPDATESDSEEESAQIPSDGANVEYPSLAGNTPSHKTQHTSAARRRTGFPLQVPEEQKPKSRNDPGFKSIFTTLRKPSTKASPSTIRRIRETESFPIAVPGASAETAGEAVTNPPYPNLSTIPHGLPAKKRRRSSISMEGDRLGFKDIPSIGSLEANKENRRQTFNPSFPGSFPRDSVEVSGFMEPTTSSRAKSEPPDEERAAKRTKLEPQVVIPVQRKGTPVASKARKEAAASAKLRKTPGRRGTGMKSEMSTDRGTPSQGKGVLRMSRLNLLARPKDRQ
ncbi:MAG: hypothetical protein Q9160_004730 [Pyrenula sp. 1 TL-2023]